MPGQIDFKIRGAKEMERLLKELGPRTANRVGDKAALAGAKVIVKEAKRLVPVNTGKLKKSITAVVDRSKRGAEHLRAALIGFKKPVSARAHLTEYGSAHSKAHPFMRPAMDAKAKEALDIMGKTLGDGIEKEALKLAKK